MKGYFGRWILAAICALLLLFGSAIAETYDLDEALALVGIGADDMLELNEDMKEIDPFGDGKFQSTGGKSIILWRESPEKKFERSSLPITEDYEGKDLGEGHTYLCARLMEQIPENLRAKTSDEVENVLIVETRYIISGVITSRIGGESSKVPSQEEIERRILAEKNADGEASGDVDDMENADDGVALIYKPVYDCIEICYVYNLPSQSSVILDHEMFKGAELRANPGASDVWNRILEVSKLLQDQETQSASTLQFIFQEGSYSQFLSEEDYQALSEKVSDGDIDGAIALAEEIFWNMVEDLKAQDPLAADRYDQIVSARSYSALAYLVNSRGYSSVEKSDEVIEFTKAYLGRPDEGRMDSMLQDAMELLNYAEWNMDLISMAVNSET